MSYLTNTSNVFSCSFKVELKLYSLSLVHQYISAGASGSDGNEELF